MKKNYPGSSSYIQLSLFFALFLILGGYTYAQTWNGSVDSNWDNPTNWNGGNVPGPGSNVIINSSGNRPVLSTEITIKSLEIGAWWPGPGETYLTVASGGNLRITNDLNFIDQGWLYIEGGDVHLLGNFNQGSGGNARYIEMTTGSFTAEKNITLSGGTTAKPAFSAGNGTATFNGKLTVSSSGNGQLFEAENAIIEIGGEFIVENNATFNLGNSLLNVYGVVEVNGTFNGDDGVTNFYGASTIGSGGDINLETGAIIFHNMSNIRGNGTINMGNGEVIFNSDINVGSSGFVNVEDGTMTVTGNATFRGNGNLSTDNGSINIKGNASLQNGGEMNLNSGTMNVGGNATVKNGGTMNAGNAHINLQGDFSIQNNSNFNSQTSTFTFSGNENQTINVDNGDITFYNVVVEDGATVQTDGSNRNTVIIENNLTVNSGGTVNVKDNDQIDIQGKLNDEDENIIIKKPYVRYVTTPSLTEIVLEFDKDMVVSTVENIRNYSINNGINILNAEQNSSKPRFVRLTVSRFNENIEYKITINNAKARNGAEITPNHIKRFSFEEIDENNCQNFNTWTGTENTNWNNTNNWSCNSLPTLETNVLIPENLASGNYPEITAGTNALVKNLTIENNSSVRVTDNWLRIAGKWTNNGILNTESGSISFEGSSAQTIPASAFENNRIQNLRIDNVSGVNSEAIIEVTGTLKVERGNFDTGNELTLISDGNQTALIDGSGNGEVIGLVSMQRYLDKAFGYKYFSSPFQNSSVGNFAPYMDFQDPVTEFPNFYRYDENRRAVVDSLDLDLDATGWTVYTNPDNNLNVAEGYALNFGTSTDAQTIELIGQVNNGPISSRQLENNHREYTKGFHLVGNPYPSPIDWNAAQGWTRDSIDDGIYFFTASDDNQYTGTYTAYVNDISTGDSNVDGSSENIIPSMQGFFIKVSNSDTQDLITGSFGMDNRVRTNNFNQEFYRSQITEQKSLLRLEAGFKGANRKDAMVIYFSSYASPDFEKELDAHKLMNTDPAVPSFYNITTDKKELAINAIPFPESRSYKKIPLGIKADQNGQMQINLASIENLSPNFNIYLIDHEKGIGQNLTEKPDYTFTIKSGTHNSRFELMFSEEEVPSPAIAFNEPFDVKVEDGNVVIELNLEENQHGILRASTITGQILQIKEGRGKDQVTFDGITSDGVYIINLQVGKARHAKKVVIKK